MARCQDLPCRSGVGSRRDCSPRTRKAGIYRFFRQLPVDGHGVHAYVAPTLRQAVECLAWGCCPAEIERILNAAEKKLDQDWDTIFGQGFADPIDPLVFQDAERRSNGGRLGFWCMRPWRLRAGPQMDCPVGREADWLEKGKRCRRYNN